MTVTSAAPWERVEGKVQPRHRDRLAVIYIRQSTPQQVLGHGESTRLQYGLQQRAVGLGWAASRVLVIDEDLGHSASSGVERAGFQRLVSEVGLDHVGLVLGLEMSRLAHRSRACRAPRSSGAASCEINRRRRAPSWRTCSSHTCTDSY
ncbi:hypothetical protein AB0B67_45720, partial [Streptomyces spectabilis]